MNSTERESASCAYEAAMDAADAACAAAYEDARNAAYDAAYDAYDAACVARAAARDAYDAAMLG